jgi:hypothetical protein
MIWSHDFVIVLTLCGSHVPTSSPHHLLLDLTTPLSCGHGVVAGGADAAPADPRLCRPASAAPAPATAPNLSRDATPCLPPGARRRRWNSSACDGSTATSLTPCLRWSNAEDGGRIQCLRLRLRHYLRVLTSGGELGCARCHDGRAERGWAPSIVLVTTRPGKY